MPARRDLAEGRFGIYGINLCALRNGLAPPLILAERNVKLNTIGACSAAVSSRGGKPVCLLHKYYYVL